MFHWAMNDCRLWSNWQLHAPKFHSTDGDDAYSARKALKDMECGNMENKERTITHYLDLDVKTKGVYKDMWFYIINIRKEEIFLRYPWLAAYQPRFKWREATIREEVFLVIIRFM